MRLILFGFKGDVMNAVSSGAWECVTWVMLGQKSLEKPMTTHLENLEIKQGALQCCHSSRMAFSAFGRQRKWRSSPTREYVPQGPTVFPLLGSHQFLRSLVSTRPGRILGNRLHAFSEHILHVRLRGDGHM